MTLGDYESYEDIIFSIKYLNEEGVVTDLITPIVLNSDSEYYVAVGDTSFYYSISWDFLEDYLVVGTQYSYMLTYTYKDVSYSTEIIATFGGLTESDVLKQGISEQTDTLSSILDDMTSIVDSALYELSQMSEEELELLRQQNDNDVSILEGIKNVVSYLNPLSENFFVYKLVDLLIDALKSLFIPEDEYFNNYFDELMEWFSDRFGFFAYPLELILDILNRILSINFTEPIINIPDIEEPFSGVQLISATSFNFNSLLENSTLEIVHNIYLILVDAVIALSLIHLLKHKFEEVLTK